MSPFRGHLCTAEAAQLVVVDVQSRLAAAMSPEDRTRVIANTGILVQGANRLGVPVLVTEQYPKGLGLTEPELSGQFDGNTPVIDKTCFACGGAPAFQDAIKAHRRPQVVVTGMEAHVCVLQTALDLHERGHQVFAVADAVCSRDPANRDNALERLRHAGVTVTNTESVLFEWLRDARHEHFKAISALLK